MNQHASIFNDVIGPVMRGPSSSHTAASVRIGKMINQMIEGNVTEFCADFDKEGSLATTYHSQSSDIGLIGGVLGMDTSDDRLLHAIDIATQNNIKVSFNIVEYEAEHPNTYKMRIKSDMEENVQVTALSVGGGMIEIINVNGFHVHMTGGFYETLIFIDFVSLEKMEKIKIEIESVINDYCFLITSVSVDKGLINIKTDREIHTKIKERISKIDTVVNVMILSPVLPILSQKERNVPFRTASEMLKCSENEKVELWEMAMKYESIRGNISLSDVFEKMRHIVKLMKISIETGLKGTQYTDRILGTQSSLIKDASMKAKLIGGNMVTSIIANVSAIMESKSSMGVIVAAPTAGSCGGLPGTVIAVATEMECSEDDMIKAMLSAGIIGVFIAEHSTFAAEVAGCQAECGAGSGMAAAALVQLMGGTAIMAVDAASMALQNIFGMVCDPVAGRVEVPCLGKNIMCGMNALSCANMVVAGYDKVIPLDETIEALDKVGRMIPSELRCTGNGGLSLTKTSINIMEKLN